MKTYGRSPIQDAMEDLRNAEALDRATVMFGLTPTVDPSHHFPGAVQHTDSRARAFSTDRRAALGLAQQHRPAECPRCGDPLIGGRCWPCERDLAEWRRNERRAVGDDPRIGWKGLAIACGLWLAFVGVVAFAVSRAPA